MSTIRVFTSNLLHIPTANQQTTAAWKSEWTFWKKLGKLLWTWQKDARTFQSFLRTESKDLDPSCLFLLFPVRPKYWSWVRKGAENDILQLTFKIGLNLTRLVLPNAQQAKMLRHQGLKQRNFLQDSLSEGMGRTHLTTTSKKARGWGLFMGLRSRVIWGMGSVGKGDWEKMVVIVVLCRCN